MNGDIDGHSEDISSHSRASSAYCSSFQRLPSPDFVSKPDNNAKTGFELSSDSEEKGASVSSGVYNLSTSIVGAGIMGLPAKMEITGLPFGLALLVLIGFVVEYSIQVLVRCSAKAKVTSYADLMAAAYGRIGRHVTTILVVINNLGILVIYLIIIGEVLAGSDSTTGLLEEWAGRSTWWTSRVAVLGATCIFILAPLVSLEHVDSLHWSSFFAIALAGVFIVVTIAVTIVRLLEGTIDFSQINWTPSFGSGRAILQLFTVVPTITTAFVCHFNVHPIYAEISAPKDANMRLVVRISLVLCTATYIVTGLFGYLLFGNAVEDDVLTNFEGKDLGVSGSELLCDIVRATFVVHLMLVFPVIHFSLRTNLDAALFPTAAPLSTDKYRFVTITACGMLLSFLLAILLPDVGTAFDFTGSLASISLAFTLPGLIAVSATIGSSSVRERGVAWAMVVMGLLFSILGLVSNIESVLPGSSS